MTLHTKNLNSNYLAKVVVLGKVWKHPNADKLSLTSVDNSLVIVGNYAKEGDTYVYFPLECAINKTFLASNNSFADSTLNSNKEAKGFFRDTGRVRAVKLRGILSEGYLVPASVFFNWVGYTEEVSKFVGKEFDTAERNVNGVIESVLICEKYVPYQERSKGPANIPKKDKTKRFNRLVPGQFHFHVDTQQLKKNIHQINPEDIITITEKLHGTSAVYSKILVNRKLGSLEKLARFFGVKVKETEYDVIYSSRSVIKNQYIYAEDKKLQQWYKEDIWALGKSVVENALLPGMTIYAELVGYLPSGGWIQKGYDYGCDPNKFKVYVYRITKTDVDGNVLEYTTNQCLAHCKLYGLEFVPIHFYGEAQSYTPLDFHPNTPMADCSDPIKVWRESLLNVLSEEFLEKKCKMCKTNVPAEGIVVTVEKSTFTPFKLKSQAFFLKETEDLDNGEIDIETLESSNKENI